MTRQVNRLALVLTGLLFLFSCGRDLTTENVDPQADLIADKDVLLAKKWHDRQNTHVSARLDSLKLLEKSPEWSNAVSYKMGSETIVELPIAYRQPQGISVAQKGDVNQVGEAYVQRLKEDIAVISKYVVIKDETGNYRALIMKVVGSFLFYASHQKSELSTSSYKSVPADFSGHVLFYDWSEKLLYGYKYQVGELIGRCSVGSKPNGRQVQCVTKTIAYWSQACVEGYGCGPYQFMYAEDITTCFEVPADPGTGGTGGGGATGGGTTTGGAAVQNAQGAYYLPAYDSPVIDPTKYTKCFGVNQQTNAQNYNFRITVFVQEPSSHGGGSSVGFENGPGHVFLGLTKESKTNPNDKITQVLGFIRPIYPCYQPGMEGWSRIMAL